MWLNDRDVAQGGSRFVLRDTFDYSTALSILIDFGRHYFKIVKYKTQIPVSFPRDFWAQPLFLFPIFKGSIFIFWGRRNKLYMNNQFQKCSVLLSFVWFCFCLKRIMFSVHSLFLLLMKVRIFRSPRCYSLPPWSPPLYCRWNGQFGSQYRDHHEDDDHSFHSKCSPLNLILCFQFVCSCHVTIRMQHKTIYNSRLKLILKNMRICLAGEILCTGKFQFPASLSNAKSPLYFHDRTNPLFVLVGTE